jgi:hypothetical protein
MTITTVNNPKNPKNDSGYARHRSTWKKNTNVISTVLTNLTGAQYVTFKSVPYYGTPRDVRLYWNGDFRNPLPDYAPTADQIIIKHYSGVDTWLAGTNGGPFLGDMQLIWADFASIFAKRSNPGGTRTGGPAGTTQELLFICHTLTHFDLIYSKWGRQKDHHFFHWTSDVTNPPPSPPRPGIDQLSDDPGG